MMRQIVNQNPAIVMRNLLKGKNVRINGETWHVDPETYQMIDSRGDAVSVDIHDFLIGAWDLSGREIAEIISGD